MRVALQRIESLESRRGDDLPTLYPGKYDLIDSVVIVAGLVGHKLARSGERGRDTQPRLPHLPVRVACLVRQEDESAQAGYKVLTRECADKPSQSILRRSRLSHLGVCLRQLEGRLRVRGIQFGEVPTDPQRSA
jgi:hypothetical protein